MLRELKLVNFRAFLDFTISFGDGAYLVGPNSAGKSTLLTAIRLADVLLRFAQSRNPTETRQDGDRHVPAWPISLAEFPALRDSVRYEFRGDEARLELGWKSGARLTAVWPEERSEERADPFFYLETKPGMCVRAVKQAREDFAGLGVIPILGPVDHNERLLTDSYVRSSISGRLSSRHFRNQLRLLREAGKLDGFLAFAEPWLDGLRIDALDRHFGDEGLTLDVFYQEPQSRVPKEIVWAGDGIQVWLQLLFHIYRVKDCPTIILDEPEVYLHPDLQRRMVHLLEATERQIVVATHSSEVAAEAEPALVTMVDKSRRRARRAKTQSELEWLSTALGSAFNLRLARALKSKVVLFVEGQDMTMLRRLSKTLGLEDLEAERGIAIIRLEGYARSDQVAPFAWLCQELLPEAMKVFVILDRDYRSDSKVGEVERDFEAAQIRAHVWRRKELESYLITPAVISRISGCPVDTVEVMLGEVVIPMENGVFGRVLDERIREEKSASRHTVDVASSCKMDFDRQWAEPTYRLSASPPKQIIAELNNRLTDAGFKSVSARSLSAVHRKTEIPSELADVLTEIDGAARPS